MYLLIATWGWVQTREYAAMKLTLYILIGSMIALVGVLAMVITASNFFTGPGSQIFAAAKLRLASDGRPAVQLQRHPDDAGSRERSVQHPRLRGYRNADVRQAVVPVRVLGFAVLAGVFPFHNWSPDGHVAAPTAVSMIHAGVLMKLGAYAALRVGTDAPGGARKSTTLDRLSHAD
ncbi:MAG: proton-conducting transporter membrane subunit [Anaerolineae bacterium]